MATFLLVPSPLLGPATWAPVADALRDHGHVAVVHDHAGASDPATVLARLVTTGAGLERPVLVPHSNAGLYAPALAARVDLAATVYVDAALAGDRPATALAPAGLRAFLADLADRDGVLPVWTDWWGPTPGLFPDGASAAAVAVEQVRLPLAYFDAVLPAPRGWAERPAAYLAFGDTYADEVAQARTAGWPVEVLAGRHLHQLHDPAGVAATVVGLARQVAAPTV